MSAATDRQWAVRDAVLRWLLAKATDGYRSPILDADDIGAEVGWVASALTHDEVSDASMFLFKENYVTGVPVMGIGIPRPMLTVAGRRVAKIRQTAEVQGRRSRSEVAPASGGSADVGIRDDGGSEVNVRMARPVTLTLST